MHVRHRPSSRHLRGDSLLRSKLSGGDTLLRSKLSGGHSATGGHLLRDRPPIVRVESCSDQHCGLYYVNIQNFIIVSIISRSTFRFTFNSLRA